MQDEAIPQTEVNHTCTSATFRNPIKQISSLDIGGGALKNILQIALIMIKPVKGAGTFHSASQSKEGSVGFGTSQHPIFMKLLPDHLWH